MFPRRYSVTMMKRLLFIYNPTAGKGQIHSSLPDILDQFTKMGYLATVYPTQRKGDAITAAATLSPGFDRVVCSGGDGTLSETAAGLMRLPPDQRRPLGYIPAGSTNDCANNLHLPGGVSACAQVACGDILRPCDMGLLHGHPFFYVAAFGAFTDVAYDTPQDLKKAFGHLAYIIAALGSLSSITSYPLTIEYDGGVIEGKFLLGLVCNTFSVGGIKALPPDKVALDDGLFEVILLRMPKNMNDLNQLAQAIFQQKPVEGNALTVLRTSRLTITSESSLPWTIDGEYGGSYLRSEIENRPRAITTIQGE